MIIAPAKAARIRRDGWFVDAQLQRHLPQWDTRQAPGQRVLDYRIQLVASETAHRTGPPRWNADQLSDLLVQFMAYRNVPIFNFEVTQEGLLNPENSRSVQRSDAASRRQSQ